MLNKKVEISVVVPVYGCASCIDKLVQLIDETISSMQLSYEVILVDDASPDKAWEVIKQIAKKKPQVKGIKLSRNFGQHYAITAGIDEASGENIVLMDCDLQDNPEYIKQLYNERKKGYEIIYTRRKNRQHGIIKKINSWIYKKLFLLFSDKEYEIDTGSLVLFSRKVAEEYKKLRENGRLYIQILKWLGFNSTTIEVPHNKRYKGKSSYNLFKMIRLGIDGWISYSNRLLKISIYIGITMSFFSFLMVCFIIFQYLFYEVQPGWSSIISTILFSSGLLLISIGVLGIYIGKIFEQVKNRPLYVIDKKINL